jgi:hypothetical protein
VSEWLNHVVVWVDPGEKTGIAVWKKDDPTNLEIFEMRFRDVGAFLSWLLVQYGPDASVGWERFIVTEETAKKAHAADWALETIGMVRWLIICNECRTLAPAAPGDRYLGKVEWLQALGWEKPGCLDDGRSASQHLLAWMLRTHNAPPEVMAKLFTKAG